MLFSSLTTIIITVVISGHVTVGCRPGWIPHGSSCYYFSTDSRDWVSASATCRAHSAELVIIETPDENEFLRLEINKLRGNFWLDGTDEFTDGKWEWASTAQPFDFTNWYPGEPNGGTTEDCLESSDSKNGKWNDLRCTNRIKFICERRLEDVVVG